MLFTLLAPWLQSRYYHHRGCKLPVMKKCQALFELFIYYFSEFGILLRIVYLAIVFCSTISCN